MSKDMFRKNRYFALLLLIGTFVWYRGSYSALISWSNSIDTETPLNVNEVKNIVIDSKRRSCPSKVAAAWDVGRFGNKFFEYLTARFTAEVLNNEIYITPGFAEVYDHYFVGRKTPIIDWTFMGNECGIPHSNCTNLPIDYLPELKPVSNESFKCIQFYGYPKDITAGQWEVIFSHRDELIKEFQWKPDLKRSTDDKLREIKSKYNTSTVVGIHVRRTDYYIYLVTNYGTFTPANASYYYKAMDYFRKKYTSPAFLVFGDDLDWIRQNLIGQDIFYTDKENDPGKDLALLSSCDHLILSYGTYGMAAAWFNNNGDVVSADNFTEKPERMVLELKKVLNLKWIWMPV